MMKTPNRKSSTLTQLAQQIQTQRIEDLFADQQRVEQFSLQIDGMYLDYSKNFVTTEIMQGLVEWAESCQLEQAIANLLNGVDVNFTEKRPALHTALRCEATDVRMVNGENVIPTIEAQNAKMAQIVACVHQGEWKGATGKAIQHIVNIGIGGSDLGPLMAVEALEEFAQTAQQFYFVSNVDPFAMSSVLNKVDPETTLFIISSKSFNTPETLANAEVAKLWLEKQLPGKDLSNHFIAVTANPSKTAQFGIAKDNILTFCNWVGGRYSIWSTIGLPLALKIGMENFRKFLAGARCMDEHFANAPLAQNMPVVLALLGAWYIEYFNASTHAVLPYAQGLRSFADYLQQLDMESNGKSVSRDGSTVCYGTGPIVWGQAGTNGQHAFYQLLHQGTHFIPVDFIIAKQTNTAYPQLHQQLLANCFAQAQALMQGTQQQKLAAHDYMPGNKPSNMLLLDKLSPFSLGQLIALYEHKVYVQGILWDINSFDQPGVELGKKLANNLLQNFNVETMSDGIDPSTRALLKRVV